MLLKKELLNSNNQKSAKETINLIQKQVMADPGIITGQTKGKLWTIDGTFKCDVPDMQGRTANYGTAAYYIANYMFFKYYGDYFQPYIQQE